LFAFSLSDTYGINRFVSTHFVYLSILVRPHQKHTHLDVLVVEAAGTAPASSI